jgi:WD40 repeat protein
LLGKKFIGTKGKGKEQTPSGAGGAAKQKNSQSCELTEMKYSPDGEYLAIASRDKTIHILSIQVRLYTLLSLS